MSSGFSVVVFFFCFEIVCLIRMTPNPRSSYVFPPHRFVYAALGSLALVGRLDAVDTDSAAAYVLACMNADGGFGLRPGAESHAGQTFCCVAALILCGALPRINVDLLGWL